MSSPFGTGLEYRRLSAPPPPVKRAQSFANDRSGAAKRTLQGSPQATPVRGGIHLPVQTRNAHQALACSEDGNPWRP